MGNSVNALQQLVIVIVRTDPEPDDFFAFPHARYGVEILTE